MQGRARLWAAMVSMVSCSAAPAAPPQEPRSLPQLEARFWFNNPPYRLRDDRSVLILFFSLDDADLGRICARLNRISRRPDLVVVGLTSDDRKPVERFIRERKIRFTVGAGSHCQRDFGVTRTPTLIRIDHAAAPTGYREVALDEAAGPAPVAGLEWESAPGAEAGEEELMAFIDSDAPGLDRRARIGELFERIGPERFLEFADEVLAAGEDDPDVVNRLEFFRRKAQGQAVDDQVLAPSMQFQAAYRQNPDGADWSRARRYIEAVKSRAAQELVADYWNHGGPDPNEVLIRRTIVTRLAQMPDRSLARTEFMRMLPAEPDFGIRGLIVSGLVQVCEPGDAEAAHFLESQAAAEPNLYHVRPWMQSGARYLRSGQLSGSP